MNVNSIIDRLSRVARPQRLALYAGGVVLVVAIWVLAFYMPLSSTRSDLEAKQTDLSSKLAKIEVRVANRNSAKVALKDLQNDLTQALKQLPNDREIPGLLKGISTLGKKVGLEVRKFQPLPEAKKEYVAEVPVALEVVGSFHEVAMFFDRLSKMNRIVYVKDLEMGTPEDRGGKVYLTVTGSAVTFRFLTEAEKELEEQNKKGKRRRRRGKAKGN
jgi:type IV pilus assembly protein PilO